MLKPAATSASSALATTGRPRAAEFETACQERGLALCVPPPRSPKLTSPIERANRTHRQAFWERDDGDLEPPSLHAVPRPGRSHTIMTGRIEVWDA
jgi:hypothetical protein